MNLKILVLLITLVFIAYSQKMSQKNGSDISLYPPIGYIRTPSK